MITDNGPTYPPFTARCGDDRVPQAAVLAEALAHPSLLAVLPVPAGIIDLVIELIRQHPFFPPCAGAVIGARAAGWRCVNGRVAFVDTVAWRCPGGATIVKEGVTIMTDQAC